MGTLATKSVKKSVKKTLTRGGKVIYFRQGIKSPPNCPHMGASVRHYRYEGIFLLWPYLDMLFLFPEFFHESDIISISLMGSTHTSSEEVC